jgi:allantoate deiminase
MGLQHLSRELIRRCDELGAISDEPGCITRTFHSPATQRANELVAHWMHAAGMVVREDAAFNLLGRWESSQRGAKTFLLGSHLDTVRNAGKYDGPLGVLLAIACVEHLREQKVTLPFHLEIVGFSDEEGVRYQTTYLGSRALAGTLTSKDLATIEEKGIAQARRQSDEFIGYAEAHIEQGPVLEAHNLGVGVVTAIAGQSRIRVQWQGRAGHAGTTPMNLRRDALCAAAELTLAARDCGVIATVGQLEVKPGASNVIPGLVTMSLDIRHQSDARRIGAVKKLHTRAQAISQRTDVKLTWSVMQNTNSVDCDPALTNLMRKATARHEREVLSLPSGAGHDAAAIAALCPVSMLFLRCKGGVSHHPDESVKTADVAKGIAVMTDFLLALKERHK